MHNFVIEKYPIGPKMEKKIENWLVEVCRNCFESGIRKIESLRESGSARQYYRVYLDSATVILCVSTNIGENKTFVKLTRYLLEKGISVPAIFAVSENFEYYLLEDLGNDDFLMLISGPERNEKLKKYIGEIISELVSFQQLPQQEWKEIVEFPPLDEVLISYDCRYALENFFKVSGKTLDESKLHEEFLNLQKKLMAYPQELWGLMFRDFQSRNIMIKKKPYFIDYQSSRRGPGIYDLVSFAWQAKANFTEKERGEITDCYIINLTKRGIYAEDCIKSNLPYWAMFRILQTLGAYGLRGLKEGKIHFIESIPYALANLRHLLQYNNLIDDFSEIYRLIQQDPVLEKK